MILIPILALTVGILLGSLLAGAVPVEFLPYVGVAVLASLDSVFGGTRSQLDGKFQPDIFITGFFANIAAATFFVWLGDNIGIGLVQVAAVVFGIRMFTNLSLIRRILINRWAENKARRQAEKSRFDLEDSQA